MRNLNRFALLLLAVVVIALAVYAYPSPSGVVTLLGITLAIAAILAILAILVAGTFGRRPIGVAIILFLAATGVVAASWGRVSARMDSDRLASEIRAAGPDRLGEALALSTTRAAGLVRQIEAIADVTRAEIESLVTVPDPALAGFFETPQVLDPAAVARVSQQLSTLVANSGRAPAEIERILAEEEAEVHALDIRLPDSQRLLLLAAVRDRIAADRGHYLALAGLNAAHVSVLDRMAAYLADRPGEYVYDEVTLRARFADLPTDEGYMALLIERASVVEQTAAILAAGEARATDTTLALLAAIAAPP